MNSSLVEEVSYFLNGLWIVNNIERSGTDFQAPLESAVDWISFIKHLKYWGIRICNQIKHKLQKVVVKKKKAETNKWTKAKPKPHRI